MNKHSTLLSDLHMNLVEVLFRGAYFEMRQEVQIIERSDTEADGKIQDGAKSVPCGKEGWKW